MALDDLKKNNNTPHLTTESSSNLAEKGYFYSGNSPPAYSPSILFLVAGKKSKITHQTFQSQSVSHSLVLFCFVLLNKGTFTYTLKTHLLQVYNDHVKLVQKHKNHDEKPKKKNLPTDFPPLQFAV